jgi:ketosteroid isomerase-like protein
VTVPELVRSCFTAFHSRDRETMEGLFSDDFTFSSPRDDHIGKAEYFERCWPPGDRFRGFEILKLIHEGDEAFVLYELETKDGERFRNTEFFRCDGDQVKEVDVYFGRTVS